MNYYQPNHIGISAQQARYNLISCGKSWHYVYFVKSSSVGLRDVIGPFIVTLFESEKDSGIDFCSYSEIISLMIPSNGFGIYTKCI